MNEMDGADRSPVAERRSSAELGGQGQPARRLDVIDRMIAGGAPALLRGPARLGWWGAWLVFLAYPVSDIVAGRFVGPAAPLAGIALAVFVGLYLLTGWTAFGVGARSPRGLDLIPYLALMAFTLAVIIISGGRWGELTIYLGVATGWALGTPVALLVLAGLAAFDLAGALLRVGPLGDIVFDTFLTVALGVSMIMLRRITLLIAELRAAREEVARLAVADERLRFARDLHDVLGHSLSVIALQSQLARRLMSRDAAAAEAALSELEVVTQESLGSLREMVTGYRQRSLGEELRGAQEVLAAAGIGLEVVRTTLPLPAASDELLAWVVREGVTNVLRHSHAHSCRIAVRSDPSAVRLELADDGVGGTVSPGGSGLRGLQERMAQVGGTLEAGPGPGGGFRLAVQLPVATA
jgi:two-component system, NarL family, sensor histidine kinase DesK